MRLSVEKYLTFMAASSESGVETIDYGLTAQATKRFFATLQKQTALDYSRPNRRRSTTFFSWG